MTASYHKSVMLHKCISALNIHPEGIYVDATFGGGGHSLAILESIKGGHLISFDCDKDVLPEAKRIQHNSFSFYEANFVYIKRYLKLEGIEKVNGILADLGVSSYQIDTPKRGFSIRYDGVLDMRMDDKRTLTATQIVNEYTTEELSSIFYRYGEIKNAKILAQLLVETRKKKTIMRCSDLLNIIEPLSPHYGEFKYYAQVFQALRIEVNGELEALEEFMKQCGDVLEIKGRLVVLSYHSLEDRIIKRFMHHGNMGNEPYKDLYGNPKKPFKVLNRKPIRPQEKEILENNRARSAKLRIAERI